LDAFKNIFKPISESDIDNYRKSYIGSEIERTDIKKAYVNGKGCINYLMEHVPFMLVEDEPRIADIINEMIKSEEVPEFKAFTNEPKSKRDRRHKKYARESREAEEIKAKMMSKQNDENDLAKQIMKRNEERGGTFNSFMDKLLEKYGNVEDDEEFDVKSLGKKIQKGKKKNPPSKEKKETPIKSGRVTKNKK
jgi:DnaJ homolog subfamily C member 9